MIPEHIKKSFEEAALNFDYNLSVPADHLNTHHPYGHLEVGFIIGSKKGYESRDAEVELLENALNDIDGINQSNETLVILKACFDQLAKLREGENR